MKQFLKEQKPVILCEVAWGSNHPYWDRELKAFEYLYSLGYSRESEEYIRGLNATSEKDILFVPQGK
jgi:hypothetical protein